MENEAPEERKKRLARERGKRWRAKPASIESEQKRAKKKLPARAARRVINQMRLQAGRAWSALQNALSGPAPANMKEASHNVLLRAEANIEAAILQAKITKELARTGYFKLESEEMAHFMAEVREQWPAQTDLSSWQKVFNPVKTRFQQRLEHIGSRSPYHAAAQVVLNRVVPYINGVLFGQQLHLTCVNGVFLVSKKCKEADAVPQGAHRDWQYTQLMQNKEVGFPVGVLISVMDGGKFHFWPDSLDSDSVSRADMITIQLKAGDIVLFNGAAVHAGAGYVGVEGEVHIRIHFYTCSTEHRRIWHVSNKTELVQCIE
jgi:hypothetical protein